jgi:hypothetical protein
MYDGMASPSYMSNVGQGMDAGGAEAFQQGLSNVAVLGPVLGNDVVATTLFVVGGTGMAVGGIIAFVLDNTVQGTRDERGLTQWEAIAEEDFQSIFDRMRGGGEEAPAAD